MTIEQVLELEDVVRYLKKRNLIASYKQVKTHLLAGHVAGAQLRKRQPRSEDIWYFRINKQYRALCYFEETTVIVFHIDDHQN